MISAISDLYNSPQYSQCSFESDGINVYEKKFKTDFQDGGHGHHTGFLTGMILAIFDLQVAPILPIVSSQLAFCVKDKNFKRDFQDDVHLGFRIGMILAIFFIYKSP